MKDIWFDILGPLIFPPSLASLSRMKNKNDQCNQVSIRHLGEI